MLRSKPKVSSYKCTIETQLKISIQQFSLINGCYGKLSCSPVYDLLILYRSSNVLKKLKLKTHTTTVISFPAN